MKDSIWPSAVNLQNAVESNIPLLSSLLFAFLGAFFVTISLSELAFLSKDVDLYPIVFDPLTFTIPGLKRKGLMMFFCFIPNLFFYLTIVCCILSQINNYSKSEYQGGFEKQFLEGNSEADFKIIKEGWNNKKKDFREKALIFFNFGILFIPIPFLVLISDRLIIIGLTLLILLIIFNYKKLFTQQS